MSQKHQPAKNKMSLFSSQNVPRLPPGCELKPQQSQLSLSISSIQFLQTSSKPAHIHMQMWGIASPTILKVSQNSLVFPIHTNALLFHRYLYDMKVMPIKLCDNRNNQQLGTGLINWVLYIRKLQIKNTPFIQNIFDIEVPIFNFKRKQIAQIKFSVFFEITKQINNELYGNSSEISSQNMNNRKNSIKYDSVQRSMGIIQAQTDKQINKQVIKSSMSIKNKKNTNQFLNKQSQLRSRHKIVSILHEGDDDLYQDQVYTNKVNKPTNDKGKKHSKFMDQIVQKQEQSGTQNILNKDVRYPDSCYQLEKTKLKLQTQEFLTLTKNQYQKAQNENKGNNIMTVKLQDFVIMKPNTFIQYLDIFISLNQKYRQKAKDQGNDKKQIRIFPNKQNNFSADLTVRQNQIIQIQIAKSLAKGSIQVKNIKNRSQIKCFIYAKTGKFGTISFSDITSNKIQNNAVLMNTKSSPKNAQVFKKTKPNPQISQSLNQLQKQHSNLSLKNPLFFLINIHELCPILKNKSNSNSPLCIYIKNYEFSEPLPSSSIIPLQQLGTIFGIQFRNSKNQTQYAIFVQDHRKFLNTSENAINSTSLGCHILKNGKIFDQNDRAIWVNVQIMIGNMKQINYELSRYSKNKQNNKYDGKNQRQSQPHPKSLKSEHTNTRGNNRQYADNDNNGDSYYVGQRKQTISINNSIKPKQIDTFPISSSKNRLKHRSKKLYTQIPVQMLNNNNMQNSSVLSSKNKNNINQQNEQQPYLVQILCRFFHVLPVSQLSQLPPNSIKQFISLLNHYLIAKEDERMYIQFVVQMFVDTNKNENQQPVIQYEQFVKCVKGYHNFLQLWWRMRLDIIQQIMKVQPQYASKITKYSELGTITRLYLWQKVFNKITDVNLQQKIDKMLHIPFQNTPISTQHIISQLTMKSPPSQCNNNLIIDLSALIRQTIETIFQQNSAKNNKNGNGDVIVPNSISVADEIVNIKIMCNIMNDIGIELSYWQALMIIEELKAWYQIDQEQNQGIISGSVVQVWINSVLNRSRVIVNNNAPMETNRQQTNTNTNKHEQKKQQHNKNNIQKFSEQASIPHNNNINGNVNNKTPRSFRSPTNSQNNNNFSRHVGQNKSMVKSQLNQQQIENIANLLRDNDGFRMMSAGYTLSNQQMPSRQNNNNKGKSINMNMEKVLDDDLLDQSQHQDKINENNDNSNINKYATTPPQYIQLRIKSMKLKNQQILQYPTKMVIKLSQQQQNTKNYQNYHYFYCNSVDQIINRTVAQQLVYKWQHRHKSKGIIIQFKKLQLQTNNENTNNGINSTRIYGLLLADQINNIVIDQPKTKTIVLYDNSQIVGKITLQATKTKNKPILYYADKQIKIKIMITPDMDHQLWTKFILKVPVTINKNISDDNSSIINNSEYIQLELQKNMQYIVQLPSIFYKHNLQITVDDKIGHSIIPLQQLYFRKEIVGDYPVISNDQAGIFLGTVQLTMKNMHVIIDNTNNMIPNNISTYINTNNIANTINLNNRKTNKYLIIFDNISSLYLLSSSGVPSNHAKLSLLCTLFVKQCYSRRILYKSSYLIQHDHEVNKQKYSVTWLNQLSQENYFIYELYLNQYENKIRNNDGITIQMQYEGRPVAISNSVINIQNIFNNNKYNENDNVCRYVGYPFKYMAHSNVCQFLLNIGMRIILIPQQYNKYNVNRIYRILAKHRLPHTNNNFNTLIKNTSNLTTTQQRLLSLIVPTEHHTSCTSILSYMSVTNIVMNRLINQFSYADNASIGTLTIQQIYSILVNVIGQEKTNFINKFIHSNNNDNVINYGYVLSLFKQYNEHENEYEHEHQQQQYDYVQESANSWVQKNKASNSAIMDVDRIYRQIKYKYGTNDKQ